MKDFDFHDSVYAEFEEAIEYYEAISEELGQSFKENYERLVEEIIENPTRVSFRDKANEIRRGFMERFPYILLYKIEEKEIYFLALAHERKQPNYWKNRL